MLSRLLDNWRYKLAAVIIAVALRFYVGAQLNPHVSINVPIIATGLSQNLVLHSRPGTARIDLSGPSSDLDSLRTTDITCEVNLSGARAGRTPALPVTVGLSTELAPDRRDRIHIDSNTPTTISLELDTLVSDHRRVRVDFPKPAPPGFQYGVPIVSPSVVGVQCRQDVLAAIDHVTVDADSPDDTPGLTPMPVTGDFSVVARGADGKPVDGVVIDPPTVHVTVPLVRVASNKRVPVSLAIVGAPSGDETVADATVTPAFVTLTGSSDALSKASLVFTKPVDVTGVTGDVQRTVEIAAPAGLQIVGQKTVQVDIKIEKAAHAAMPPPPGQ